MKKIVLVLLGLLLVSCNKSTVIETNDRIMDTKSYGEEKILKPLFINVINNAEDIVIYLDSLHLCNVLMDFKDNKRDSFKISEEPKIIPYKDTMCCYPVIIPPQRFYTWNPNKPNNTNVVYFKAYLQIVEEVNDVVIYSGTAFIPLENTRNFDNCIIMDVSLYNKAPWYKYNNGKYSKILNSVEFNVDVDAWKE